MHNYDFSNRSKNPNAESKDAKRDESTDKDTHSERGVFAVF